jgi:hypothetical protein
MYRMRSTFFRRLQRTVVAASDLSFAAHRAASRAGLVAKAHSASLQLLHVLEGSSAQHGWSPR